VDSDKGSIFTWIVTRPCDQTKPKTKINISKKHVIPQISLNLFLIIYQMKNEPAERDDRRCICQSYDMK
jgi:hypothetical protein